MSGVAEVGSVGSSAGTSVGGVGGGSEGWAQEAKPPVSAPSSNSNSSTASSSGGYTILVPANLRFRGNGQGTLHLDLKIDQRTVESLSRRAEGSGPPILLPSSASPSTSSSSRAAPSAPGDPDDAPLTLSENLLKKTGGRNPREMLSEKLKAAMATAGGGKERTESPGLPSRTAFSLPASPAVTVALANASLPPISSATPYSSDGGIPHSLSTAALSRPSSGPPPAPALSTSTPTPPPPSFNAHPHSHHHSQDGADLADLLKYSSPSTSNTNPHSAQGDMGIPPPDPEPKQAQGVGGREGRGGAEGGRTTETKKTWKKKSSSKRPAPFCVMGEGSEKPCKQRSIVGFTFCIRHILADPQAPYTMCQHRRRQGPRDVQCTNAVHKDKNSLYCSTHLISMGYIQPKRKGPNANAAPNPAPANGPNGPGPQQHNGPKGPASAGHNSAGGRPSPQPPPQHSAHANARNGPQTNDGGCGGGEQSWGGGQGGPYAHNGYAPQHPPPPHHAYHQPHHPPFPQPHHPHPHQQTHFHPQPHPPHAQPPPSSQPYRPPYAGHAAPLAPYQANGYPPPPQGQPPPHPPYNPHPGHPPPAQQAGGNVFVYPAPVASPAHHGQPPQSPYAGPPPGTPGTPQRPVPSPVAQVQGPPHPQPHGHPQQHLQGHGHPQGPPLPPQQQQMGPERTEVAKSYPELRSKLSAPVQQAVGEGTAGQPVQPPQTQQPHPLVLHQSPRHSSLDDHNGPFTPLMHGTNPYMDSAVVGGHQAILTPSSPYNGAPQTPGSRSFPPQSPLQQQGAGPASGGFAGSARPPSHSPFPFPSPAPSEGSAVETKPPVGLHRPAPPQGPPQGPPVAAPAMASKPSLVQPFPSPQRPVPGQPPPAGAPPPQPHPLQPHPLHGKYLPFTPMRLAFQQCGYQAQPQPSIHPPGKKVIKLAQKRGKLKMDKAYRKIPMVQDMCSRLEDMDYDRLDLFPLGLEPSSSDTEGEDEAVSGQDADSAFVARLLDGLSTASSKADSPHLNSRMELYLLKKQLRLERSRLSGTRAGWGEGRVISEAAKRFPNTVGKVLVDRHSKRRGKKAVTARDRSLLLRRCYHKAPPTDGSSDSGPRCSQRCLPYANFCLRHLTNSAHQSLFRYCHVEGCRAPVLDLGLGPAGPAGPLCSAHTDRKAYAAILAGHPDPHALFKRKTPNKYLFLRKRKRRASPGQRKGGSMEAGQEGQDDGPEEEDGEDEEDGEWAREEEIHLGSVVGAVAEGSLGGAVSSAHGVREDLSLASVAKDLGFDDDLMSEMLQKLPDEDFSSIMSQDFKPPPSEALRVEDSGAVVDAMVIGSGGGSVGAGGSGMGVLPGLGAALGGPATSEPSTSSDIPVTEGSHSWADVEQFLLSEGFGSGTHPPHGHPFAALPAPTAPNAAPSSPWQPSPTSTLTNLD